jgi:type IV secretion system protein VirD4
MRPHEEEAAERRRRVHVRDPGLYGSARWATRAHLASRGYGEKGPLVFGYGAPEPGQDRAFPITYSGARHLLTVAPNRSGKGVCTCIPALLSHPGPAIVLDPRGEVATATARFRAGVLGQRIAIYDPFDAACPHLSLTADRFNALDTLDPGSPTFFDDAALIADALVMAETHGSRFWSDEARSFLTGIILQVAGDPREAGCRHLGRVREIMNMPAEEFSAYVRGSFAEGPAGGAGQLLRAGMLQSPNRYIRAAAGRILSKPERQFGDILSTAQQNTHFLESEAVQDSLAASDFAFGDIAGVPGSMDRGGRGRPMTIYLVLPPERLRTHGRLLRLLIACAIAAINGMARKPSPSCLFMLDEMGAIGRLDPVLDAFGLLAGSGMQLHPIFQDLAQAQSLYGDRWQTFIANAAVIQAFGTRDLLTAEYLSKLCGTGSVEQLSHESARRREGLLGDPEYFSRDDQLAARALITPEEVMTMHPALQLLVLASARPVGCFKAPYFLDRRFRGRGGRPLFDLPPAYRGRRLPPPIDFPRTGSRLLAALTPHLTVG